MKDITGMRFGRLTAIEPSGIKHGAICWRCVCDCGKHHVSRGDMLRNGDTKSCGCLNLELCQRRSYRHGGSKMAEYRVWAAMIQRCTNPLAKNYPRYGGRGISVCDGWLNSFVEFFRDMGVRPSSEHSIDRIDNSKGYEPDNCRWATRIEQMSNRRNNRLLTIQGQTHTMEEWARRSGIYQQTLTDRIDRMGWSPEKAVVTPARTRRPQ